MKVNKIFMVSLILLAVLTFGAVSAAENVTADLVVGDAGDVDLEVPAVDEITTDSDTEDVATSDVKEEILGTDQEKLSSASNVIVVNGSNYMNYFNQTDGGRLVDTIEPGTTLDIQGGIVNSNASDKLFIDINKPVNIISTTGDGYICLNTTKQSVQGSLPDNSFVISNGGSYSNVTGITFYNTQMWITNTTHVVFDNINVIIEQRIGSGVGSTSIRDNTTYLTLKNSYFYTRGNGAAAFTLSWADYCTIDNNTFIMGQGVLATCLSYNTYNIPSVNARNNTINSYNNFTNNYISSENAASLRVQSQMGGISNLFENNTFDKCAVSFAGSLNKFIGNTITAGGSLSSGTDSIVYNNTVLGAVTVSNGAEVYNNTFNGLTLSGTDALVHDNVINGASTINSGNGAQVYDNTFIGDYTITFKNQNAKNITFANNNIIGNIEFGNKNAKGNKIVNNTISTSKDYAINLKTYTGTETNITGNILNSAKGFGNNAVNHAEDSSLTIDNYQTANATIDVLVNDIKVGETAVINITSNETSMASVDVIVNNNERYSVSLVKGKGFLELPNLLSGEYSISVISTDLSYGGQNGTSFNVTKNNPSILVDAPAKTQWIDSNITVTIVDATGDVTLDINGTNFTSELVDGVAVFNVPDFAYGTYAFNVTYAGDYKYFGNVTNGTLTVNRNKEVKIIASDIVADKFVDKFVAKFTNYIDEGIANTNVTITIGDAIYPLVTDENGTAVVDLALTRGKYDVNVKFTAVEDEYDAASAEYNITVIDASITKIVSVGEDGLVTGALYDALGAPIANAVVVASMNETEVNLTTNDAGLFEFQAEDGCEVTFVFAGDDITTGSDASITVNIKPTPKDVSIINIVSVDGTGLITGSLTVVGNPIANVIVVATMNGTSVNLVTDANGLFEFQAQNGFETTFKYAGDLNTTDANATITLNNMVPIPKDTSIIKIVSVDGTGLITGSLTVLGNPIANASVVATVNGSDVSLTTDDNGLFEFQSIAGFETVFMYAGDNTTTSSDVAITLSNMVPVPKDISIIKIVSVDGTGLITGSLTVLGNPIANADIVASVNGEDTNLTTDADGLFKFQAQSGLETVFKYAGNDTITSSDVAITLSNMVPVPKDTSIIKIVSVDGDGLVTGSLTVLGVPIANATVVATVNRSDVNLTTDANGSFKFQAQNGLEAVFKYAGNDTVTSSDASITLSNVAHIVKDTKITVSSVKRAAVDIKAGEKGKAYTLTLKDADGNVLADKTAKVTLNGKVYTVKTDANGKASIIISLSSSKKYNINVFFMGDNDYKGSTAAAKITVTKKKTALKAAKTKYTFKAKAKSKVIKATLKTSNKYLTSGKKVTLKIKGKTYAAKVGKNGAIKLNIKALNKKGTYKAKIKFAGDSTYKASSSKTIKIVIN